MLRTSLSGRGQGSEPGWRVAESEKAFEMVERGRAQPAFGSRASWFEGQR